MMNTGVLSKLFIVSMVLGVFSLGALANQSVTCESVPRPKTREKDPEKLRRWAKWRIQVEPYRYENGMAYKYIPPAKPGNAQTLIIHGLGHSGDDMIEYAMQALMAGHGVFLPDQHGHGKTLELMQKKLQNPQDVDEILSEYDLTQNAKDMYKILRKHRVQNFYLMAHSLGGNVATWVAHEIASRALSDQLNFYGTVVMAPYAGRSDTAFAKRLLSPEFWTMDLTIKGLMNLGVSSEMIDLFFNPVYKWFSVLNSQPRFLEDVLNEALGVQKLKDKFQDPFMDPYLLETFTNFFEEQIKKKAGSEHLSPDQQRQAQLYGELTLGIAKLNRKESLLNPLAPFPIIDRPYLILAAREDTLALFEQLQMLHTRMLSKGYDAEFKPLPDPNATHFFPQNDPQGTYKSIVEFFLSRGIDITKPVPHKQNRNTTLAR